MTSQAITILTGPTASGKTAAALKIAADTDGVIVNADSMQVYKDLPILTAHPNAEERAAAPHRLYGILDASERTTAADWCRRASAEIAAILDAGQHPVLVGGSGLYIKSLIEGLSPIPDVDPDIRVDLEAQAHEEGLAAIRGQLMMHDADSFTRLEDNDTQRNLYALGVFLSSGKPLSYWQSLPRLSPPADWSFTIKLMLPEREALYAKIEKRFDMMIEDGALDEVAALASRIDQGEVASDAAIIVAHGFRALRDHLNGKISLDDAKDIGVLDTRHYAKRQFTWARHQYKVGGNVQNVEQMA
ncbi:MAG: tRNA (adenosine(37)-N6)-dimethylallyltransferase MiaA [Pseudobdellovibrionaceae bacterium]